MKICPRCKKRLPKNSYYKNKKRKSGIDVYCKKCVREYNQERRLKFPEKFKERNKRKYLNNKEKIKEYQKRYYKKNKKIKKAHTILSRAVYKGIVERKLLCEKCGKKSSVAHHADYDKPLKVIWLCEECHKEIHNVIHK